jgi:putative transposase
MRKGSFSSIAWQTARRVLVDVLRLLALGVRSRSHLAAENLFLRKQLALYAERRVKARRADDATRITLILLARVIDWRVVLTIVKPDTLIRWHRKGFRLFWRWKSKARGRPPLPLDVRRVIAAMAHGNVTWGEERIAAELALKLGVQVSPRTVRRYMPKTERPDGRPFQPWSTFVRNHAGAVLACDFFATVTARFRTLYVFVVLDVGTRRIIHWNVTEHPTAGWAIQQFRAFVPGDQPQRFVIHDRDSVYSAGQDFRRSRTLDGRLMHRRRRPVTVHDAERHAVAPPCVVSALTDASVQMPSRFPRVGVAILGRPAAITRARHCARKLLASAESAALCAIP